jgi:hypothetical protein
MTPEDRLAKIEEKHQSLAMHCEVLAGMQVQAEREIGALREAQAVTTQKLDKLIETVDNGMLRIIRILDNHEDRIQRIETTH